MHIRTRKLIGTVALILLAVSGRCSRWRWRNRCSPTISGWIAALYYVVAGLGWVLPAMPIVKLDVAAG